MKSIKVVLTIVIAVATLGVTNAQNQQRKQGPPPAPSEKQVEKMLVELKDKLKLDDRQSDELTTLFNAHFSEIKENLKEAKGQREEHRAKMEAAKKEFEDKVKQILTEEQQKLFIDFQKQHRPRKGKRDSKHDAR